MDIQNSGQSTTQLIVFVVHFKNHQHWVGLIDSPVNVKSGKEVFGKLKTRTVCSWQLARCSKSRYYSLVAEPWTVLATCCFKWKDWCVPGLLLQDMELYSTVLWHLKKDVELAHLAQHCLSTDRLAPQAW